jgi:hypothetical protein
MSGRQPRQRCCLVRSARVGHHDSALLVTREIGVSQFAMFDATSMPRCSIESSPAAADIRLILADRSTVVGLAKNGPIVKAVATLCIAVVGLLPFVVLVQKVWAQLPVFPATSNRIQRCHRRQ